MSGRQRPRRAGQVKEITSLANPLVKDIKALALKKNRDEQRHFMAEGLKLVIDALELGWPIHTLVFAKSSARQSASWRRRPPAPWRAAALVLEVTEKVLAHDHPPRQSADGGRRLRAALAAAEGHPRRRRATSGWRSTASAIPAISAPSSAPSTRSAPRASSWSAKPPIPLRSKPSAPPWARSSRCPSRARTPGPFLAWRKALSGLVVGTHLKGAVDYRSVDYAGKPVRAADGQRAAGPAATNWPPPATGCAASRRRARPIRSTWRSPPASCCSRSGAAR